MATGDTSSSGEAELQHKPNLRPPPPPSPRRGGWRAIKYILANESFEKLASMSLIANLSVYLRTKYNMSGIMLVNVVSIWGGTSNISTLAGAFLSDAYLGRFLTLLLGTFASFLGMGAMALTSALPRFRPPTCRDQLYHCIEARLWQLGILFVALGLLAVGAGGVRPCGIAFGADQFDIATEKGRKRIQSFFNWWYLSFTMALLIALSLVVYIQTEISWFVGFIIPTGCLFIAILLSLIGRHTYIYVKPQGSIFGDMAKVLMAAFRKRKITLKSTGQYSFHDPPTPIDAESGAQVSKLAQTRRFRWLDKAAIIVEGDELNDLGMPKNSWPLCSVQQVEQLKCLVGIVPVWVTGVGCMLVMDQQNSFGMLQAMQMNRSVGSHFRVPPGWLGMSGMVALAIWILFYERVYIPVLKRILKRDVRLTMAQRITTGIIMSILCMLAAGIIEERRRAASLEKGSFVSPLSLAWLMPQFVLSGLTEAFENVAMMEFFTTQMPESMRSVAGSVFFVTLSTASYLSSFIVNVIHVITKRVGRTPWLGGHDLNKNRLDYYYYIIAAVGAINMVYFTFFASNYVQCGKTKPVTKEIPVESQGNLPAWGKKNQGEHDLAIAV